MKKTIAKQFDAAFDKGEDVTDFLDVSTSRHPKQQLKRINVDFPVWMIERLDREAKHLGMTRQAIIKVWLAERLERSALTEAAEDEEPAVFLQALRKVAEVQGRT